VAFDVDTSVSFSPDGKQFCFRRHVLQGGDSIVIMDLESGKERELILVNPPELLDPISMGISPAWSPDGKRIALAVSSPVGGMHTWIVTIDVASGERKNLGSGRWLFVDSIRWLPDGRAILLSGSVVGLPGFDIYRASFPEGEVRRLTNELDGYRGLSLSFDGKSIAAIRRTIVSNIHTVSLGSGREERPLTFATGWTNSVEFIAPLSDGSIAFTSPQGTSMLVFRIEPDGSGRRPLTSQGIYVVNLEFGSDAGLVFTQVEKEGIFHVWRMNPDGSGLRKLTDGAGEALVALAREGRTVLFRKAEMLAEVWAVDLAGGEPRLVLPEDLGGDVLPTRDGRRLMYEAKGEMEGRIYPKHVVIPIEGGDPVASFVLPPGAEDVQWAPEGEAVTYIDRGKGFNLMRRSIARDDAVPLTRFTDGRVRRHEWSPDGRKIFLHRRVGQQDSLWLLEPGTGAPPLELTRFKSGRIFNARWARDSGSVVFTYGSESQDVVLITDFR
jgi:Tol biopolymer transport system component